MNIGIPVERELLDLEHLEGAHLALLVVDVDEGALEPAVGRGPDQLLDREAHVEGSVHTADALVFKSEVEAMNSDAEVLNDDLAEARRERLLLLFLFLQLFFGAHRLRLQLLLHLLLLLLLELLEELLEFLLLEAVQDALGEGGIVLGRRVANDVDIIDAAHDRLGHYLIPGHIDLNLPDVASLHDNRRAQRRRQALKSRLLEYGILLDYSASPAVDLDILLREVLQQIHEGIHEYLLEKQLEHIADVIVFYGYN